MATIVGGLHLVAHTQDTNDRDAFYFSQPNHVASVTTSEGTFLYTTSVNEGRIQALKAHADGSVTSIGPVPDLSSYVVSVGKDLVTVETGTGTYLAAAASGSSEIILFTVNENGSIALSDRVADDASLPMQAVQGLTSVTINGRSFVYGCSKWDDGIVGFEVDADGNLVEVANVTGQLAPYFLYGVKDLTTFEWGGQTYLASLSNGSGDSAVTLFSVGRAGRLTLVEALDGLSGLNTEGNGSIATATVDGATYIYASSGTDGISILELRDREGEPYFYKEGFFSDPAYGHRAEWDRFDIRGSEQLVSFSGDAVGFTVFDLSLTPGDLADNLNRYDEPYDVPVFQATDGVKVEIDGTPYYFVASAAASDHGIYAYEIGGGEDLLDGTRDDDALIGLAARDVLHGRAGDDVLDGGEGGDILIGGAGRDIADYSLAGGGVTVDLARGTGGGSDAAGDRLYDIEGILGSDFDDILRGDGGRNELDGGHGDDTLVGRGGNDRLFGKVGNDLVQGGAGADLVEGAGGEDILDGGGGNDDINGGVGGDTISGGNGRDVLDGAGGNDVIDGGKGADTLIGGTGNDRFVFGNGDGIDTVEDFEAGLDVVDLSGISGLSGFADLNLGQTAAGVVVTFSVADTITLLDARLPDLDAGSFIF